MRESRTVQARGSAQARLADAARTAGWTLGAWAAMQVGAAVLARNAMAALAVQVALAEWCAGKLAITWSDPLAPPGARIRQRATLGAAFGLAGAALVVVLALATRQASIAPASPALGSLLLGAAMALLAAVRDELVLRAMVLRIGRPLLGPAGALVLCALAAAAVRLGGVEPTALAAGVEALRGLTLALVWTRDRGAWMAVGANAAWVWGLDNATRGDLLDVRFRAEPGSSVQALVALAILGSAAAWWAWPRGDEAAST